MLPQILSIIIVIGLKWIHTKVIIIITGTSEQRQRLVPLSINAKSPGWSIWNLEIMTFFGISFSNKLPMENEQNNNKNRLKLMENLKVLDSKIIWNPVGYLIYNYKVLFILRFSLWMTEGLIGWQMAEIPNNLRFQIPTLTMSKLISIFHIIQVDTFSSFKSTKMYFCRMVEWTTIGILQHGIPDSFLSHTSWHVKLVNLVKGVKVFHCHDFTCSTFPFVKVCKKIHDLFHPDRWFSIALWPEGSKKEFQISSGDKCLIFFFAIHERMRWNWKGF